MFTSLDGEGHESHSCLLKFLKISLFLMFLFLFFLFLDVILGSFCAFYFVFGSFWGNILKEFFPQESNSHGLHTSSTAQFPNQQAAIGSRTS